MARVLIIDDDAGLLDVLSLSLEDAGHQVSTARDGIRGLAAVKEQAPELVVCDVNMPGLDGFTLCRRLREHGNRVPVIMLTSRDNEIDEALGLELGADDYVTKPFAMRVLLARIAALLRREALRSEAHRERPISRGGVELFVDRLEVRYRDVPVAMTVTEIRLLEVLMNRPGQVFTRTQLLQRVRGDGVVVGDRIVDTYVRRIRRKLESVDAEFAGIETMIGVGYRWRDG